MSVLDNVTLASRVVHGVPRPQAEAAAMEMLERVGLADKAKAKPDSLSGGQQQRVAIARALVNKPVLMLFDEVTSALDPELVGEVLGLLTELKSEGMTMLVATHEMGFARQVADEVVFLADGGVAESGPPEQVLPTRSTHAPSASCAGSSTPGGCSHRARRSVALRLSAVTVVQGLCGSVALFGQRSAPGREGVI